MPKQVSHSAHIAKIEHADGSLRFKRPRPAERTMGRSRQSAAMGDDLVTWASVTDSEGAERIRAILDLIIESSNLDRHDPTSEPRAFSWQGRLFEAGVRMGRGFYPERGERETSLDRELSWRLGRYQLSPLYWMTLGDFPVVGWWSKKERPKDPDEPDEDVSFTEEDAVIRILDLAREGGWNRLRRCHCGDYFFANFSHQKFCSTGCQQRYYRDSAEYKEKRRLYMKELRAIHKKTVPKTIGSKRKAPRTSQRVPTEASSRIRKQDW